MRIALVQTNPLVGDVAGNTARLVEHVRALRSRADLIVFPEQSLLGYPAKDLLLRRELIRRNVEALQQLAAEATGCHVLAGFAEPNEAPHGRLLFNSAALLHEGRIVAVRRKQLLPTYDVFDEGRYFEPAGPQQPLELGGLKIGVTICEDLLWDQRFGRPLYDRDPTRDLAAARPDLVINISASPFTIGKHPWRIEHLGQRTRRIGAPLIYVNQVGGNDELIFDGASCVLGADGRVLAQLASFREDVLVFDAAALRADRREPVPQFPADLHDALILGIRDYVRKCGFREVVVGLSGGIDSSVVASLAAEALGPQAVLGVAMPSRFSSTHSVEDARQLAANLRIRFLELPIEPAHRAFEQILAEPFAGREPDVTEENIQARVRGVILMALSNKFGALVLSTGNKSELAAGYCTLYGDMAGGLAVISDVPKTSVYRLAEHINKRAGRQLIPQRVLTKPPSAELRPNQTDQDTLPPYEVLDAILERYEERLESRDEIVAAGFDPQVVDRVIRLLHASEYKRQQAAPGLKVTPRAFGFGRRMPIAAAPLG